MKILSDKVVFDSYEEFKLKFNSTEGDEFMELFVIREPCLNERTFKVVSIGRYKSDFKKTRKKLDGNGNDKNVRYTPKLF